MTMMIVTPPVGLELDARAYDLEVTVERIQRRNVCGCVTGEWRASVGLFSRYIHSNPWLAILYALHEATKTTASCYPQGSRRGGGTLTEGS